MANESMKHAKSKKNTNQTGVVKDYGNDPYFVKKADDSRKFLEKYGFPQEISINK